MHIDVNNAFLSWTAIDLLNHGYKYDIRNFCAVIGGDEENRRGVVLAKSINAKKVGIVSGESLFTARKKFPRLKVYPPNYEFYEEMSNKLFDLLSKYTPDIQKASIDECYLDYGKVKKLYGNEKEFAYKLKDEIKNALGFTVNIGIANNMLCAKMASDFLKPDKVHTLFMEEVKNKMWPLPINDLLFVGKSSSKILIDIGIKTIGDLAKVDANKLKKHFKNRVDDLIKSANGIDDSIVNPNSYANKCISISRTLKEDTSDEKILKKILLDMANSVGLRARKKGLFANTIAITFKTSSFKNYSHQEKLVNSTNNTMEIYHKILNLYDEIDKEEKIRNIGIRLGDLIDHKKEQVSLFTDKKDDNDQLQKLMDDINSKYNSSVVMPAIFFEEKK